MGGSSWSDTSYRDAAKVRSSTGASAFAHTAAIAAGTAPAKAHTALDPSVMKGGARESRDSEAHPNSNPVAVFFDVTGSMHQVPQTVQKKLPNLMGLLVGKNCLEDPAILVAAIGDAYTDEAPVQIGQFESGNEIEKDLGNVFLEGKGGGQDTESYELALYFLARKTKTDAWEKRSRKGYAFIIGDERAYSHVDAKQVKEIFGDTLQENIPIETILAEAQERWHIFFILPNLTSHWNNTAIQKFWSRLLGQNAMRLEDPDGVAELIATTIGLSESNLDASSVERELVAAGTSSSTALAVARAAAAVKGTAVANPLTGTNLDVL